MRNYFRPVTPTRSLMPTRRQRQHGQSAVEIALMLPLLMILIFGIITSGFMFYAYIQVSNGTREAARAGSLYRTIMATACISPSHNCLVKVVKSAVYDQSTGISALGGLPVTPANPSVDVISYIADHFGCGETAPCSGDQITAQVTYSYTQPILSSFVPIFPQPMVIQRTIVMELQ